MKSTASEDNNTISLNLSFGNYKFKRHNNRISKQSILRLFKRAGCRRVSKACFAPISDLLHLFLRQSIGRSIEICVLNHRKTVSTMDVLYALKLTNIRFYI